MEIKLKEAKKILEELKKENRKLKEELKKMKVRFNEKEKKLNQESNLLGKLNEKVESILKSHKSPWETKLALFNLLKDLRVEESSSEEKRENYLLESCLLNHLAKESMKKYRKITAQSFSEKK